MKMTLYFFIGLFGTMLNAQDTDKIQVRQTIDEFFKAFHAQDSIAIRNTVHTDVLLQTIGSTKEGKPIVRTENFDDFVKSIVSIPDSINFQERLTSYNIQIDGPMANAWTSYEFWLNNEFHHCGVNSFQLFHEADAWKIIYLIDTRRKENCSTLPE